MNSRQSSTISTSEIQDNVHHYSARRHFLLRVALPFAALFVLGLCSTGMAQKQGLAHSGPRGIWVDLGNKMLPAPEGGRTIQSYRVERRERGAKTWAQVASISGPATQLDFDNALRAQYYHFPELQLVRMNVAEIWARVKAEHEIKSLRMIGKILPVQVALGVRWLDSTVQPNKVYEYRVSRMDASGSVLDDFTTPSLSYPRPSQVARVRAESHYADAGSANIVWKAGSGEQPTGYSVFRREGISGSFLPLPMNLRDSCCIVSTGLLMRKDTVLLSVVDRTVRPGTVYQYYVLPRDYFQNTGKESDTVTVLSFNMSHVPLPEYLKIHSVDTVGLRLRWNLRDTSAVYGIVIERSANFDTGYVELYTASPLDTSFIDASVTPMQRYYYRLRLVGPTGVRSAPSAKVIGTFQSSAEPTPPMGVAAEGVKDGVRISWLEDTTQPLEGFFVYRGGGTGDSLRQISPMLPPKTTSYLDTSHGLRGGMSYVYGVRSMSTSHVQSRLSDTASAVPLIRIPVATPMGLHAAVDGRYVNLFWTGQQGRSAGLEGYRVYRSDLNPPTWKPLTDTLLSASQNWFQDVRTEPGKRYSYTVRAYSIARDSSALSIATTASIPLPEIFPPGNLRARADKEGVTLEWDEIVQPAATGFKLYRYTRGKNPVLVATLKSDAVEYLDKKAGKEYPVFYYLTTLAAGQESRPGREVAVVR